MKDHVKLFIPGPVEVNKEVLEAMSKPMIGHRTQECSDLQRSATEKMKKLLYTDNLVLFSTSSGTGLLETAIRNCTAKKAIVFSVGAFGNRWYNIAQKNGIPADKHEVEWGNAITPEMVDEYLSTGKYDVIAITHNETSTGVMNPVYELSEVIKKYPDVVWIMDAVSSMSGAKIEVDKLGVDFCLASSQKAFAVPPGLAMASVSQKALDRAKKVENRGFYFDLLRLEKYIKERDHQYPSTPTIPHMYGIDKQLDRIIEEGIENRFKRHKEIAQYVRDWAKEYFDIFADERYLSETVTCIENTRNIDIPKLNEKLRKRNMIIANGYGKLKNKTFRIAHMGETTVEDLKELFNNINEILNL
ncbi:MAG TPA: alanine--glyoxylate aminotransferase family protein [Candidatus Mcinerneyibacterium sp.]|nr:alanine--glyoxylate aminotransferase family protein [Candidatus Mcinerneyibacterium sp.]